MNPVAGLDGREIKFAQQLASNSMLSSSFYYLVMGLY